MIVAVGVINLTSCSILELAHDPLNCIDRPIPLLKTTMSFEEIEPLTDATYKKLKNYIGTYKKRIKSQCELIKKHNENHKAN